MLEKEKKTCMKIKFPTKIPKMKIFVEFLAECNKASKKSDWIKTTKKKCCLRKVPPKNVPFAAEQKYCSN